MFTKINKKANEFYLSALLKKDATLQRIEEKLREDDGSFFVENGLAIVIAVVLAGISIVLLIALLRDKIMANADKKVDDFFNMAKIALNRFNQ